MWEKVRGVFLMPSKKRHELFPTPNNIITYCENIDIRRWIWANFFQCVEFILCLTIITQDIIMNNFSRSYSHKINCFDKSVLKHIKITKKQYNKYHQHYSELGSDNKVSINIFIVIFILIFKLNYNKYIYIICIFNF